MKYKKKRRKSMQQEMFKERKKKSIFKRWWFWAGAFVVVTAIIGQNTPDAIVEKNPDKQQLIENKASAPNVSKPKAKKNDAEITLEEFYKIENGMSYEKVKKIVGSGGELTSSGGSGEYKIDMVTFEGNTFASNAIITFTNGKVSSKTQYGLE
jgi:hypothetical protein